MGKLDNTILFRFLLFIVFIFIGITIYKYFVKKAKPEGFQQNDRFVLKENEDIYDEFYSEIYDDLMQPDELIDFEISQIIQITQPSSQYSHFLDVGSGTGGVVHKLKRAGYNAVGIDKSKAMVDLSLKKYPDLIIKNENILNPHIYDHSIFTHILCINYTIYEIQDKAAFFKNCYYWMIGNGYLMLHLVDRDKFDPIIPAGKPEILDSPQQYGNRRITDTIIDFIDFGYHSSYKFDEDRHSKNGLVVHKETFTDKNTQNVRQNERNLYMEKTNDILLMAIKSGFIVKGKISMEQSAAKDKHQYLYILERTL